MKKKVLSTILFAMLIASVSIGGTLAYLTSTTKTVKNTFTVGNVEIKLDEAKVSTKTDVDTGKVTWEASTTRTEEGNTYSGIYPGAELPKDPTVTNTGSSSAYVRVKVTVDNWDVWKKTGITDLSKVFTVDENWPWTLESSQESNDGKSVTYTYRYNNILLAGKDTGALFTKVTIPSDITSELMAQFADAGIGMSIIAEAIQVDGFANADAAWTAFDNK